MTNLIKKLFYPKNDYVKILSMRDNELEDEFQLNRFLDLVRNENGRIIKLNNIQKVNSESNYDFLGLGENKNDTATNSSNNYFLIFYKCIKKIEYSPYQDKITQDYFRELFLKKSSPKNL